MNYRTCLDYLIYRAGYKKSGIGTILHLGKQSITGWTTENYKRSISEEYVKRLEKLFKIPREYWLDDKRRCLLYTEERKDKICEYYLKKKWSFEWEKNSDIIEELIEKYNRKEKLEDLAVVIKRLEVAKQIQEMYNEEMTKEEEHHYIKKLEERYSKSACEYLKKNCSDCKSNEEYYATVNAREKMLQRVYDVLKNTEDEIIEVIIDSLEMYNEIHAPFQRLGLPKSVSKKICDLLIEEEKLLIQQKEEEVEEFKKIFGDNL